MKKVIRVSFPTSSNPKVFLIIIAALYAAFCIDPDLNPINVQIFYNDLSQPDVFSWLFSQVLSGLFIFYIAKEGCARVENRLVKSILFAIMIDSLCTIFFALLFSYTFSVAVMVLRNSFSVGGMFYAYYILKE